MNFPLNRPEELKQNVSTSPILLKLLEESRKNYIHWHDHAEILLILEGFQRIEISGRLYEFKEGDFMWLSPRVIHSINPDESRPSKFYSMLYDETYVLVSPAVLPPEGLMPRAITAPSLTATASPPPVSDTFRTPNPSALISIGCTPPLICPIR